MNKKFNPDAEVSPEILQKAQMRMGNSRARLLLHQPFYGVLLSMVDFIAEKTIPTMATDGAKIYYNPEYVCEITDDEVFGVILHEISHCIYLHLTGKRRLNRAHKRWNFACFTADTVLPGSFKAISEVSIGDKVMGSNGQYQKIVETMVNDYNGDLYTIRASGTLPFRCTEEHPIRVVSRKLGHPVRFNEPTWKIAKDIKVGTDYLMVPIADGKDTTTKIDLTKYLNQKKTGGHNQCHNVADCVKDGIELTEEFAWFMGIYAAEGSKNSSISGGLNFALHTNETEYEDRINKMAIFLGYKPYTVNDYEKKSKCVKIGSTVLSALFEEHIGRGAKNKKIPDFILFNQNTKLLESFLDGLFSGDGCQVRKNTNQLGTTSLTLALQTQLAIGRLGYFTNVRKNIVKERMFGDQVLPEGFLYTVDWTKSTGSTRILNSGNMINSSSLRWKRYENNYLVPVTKIMKENFNGKVYNIGTEDHTYTVSNALVHNCDFAINLEIKDLGYALPSGLLLDQKYRDMCAEQIYDLLPEEERLLEAMGEQFDVHISNTDETQWDDMEDKIITAYELTKNSKGKGDIPAGIKRWIDKLRKSRVKWERVFHRYVGQALAKDDYSFTRVNKRFLGQDLYLPDMRSHIIGSVWISIDTSGSIGKNCLEQFAAEIAKISYLIDDLTVITCDAEIQEVVKIKKFENFLKKLKFKGGGGTSHKPVFEYIKKMKAQPELLINLTDMYSDIQDIKDPHYPVLWISTSEIDTAPFGHVVRMPNEKGEW